MELRHLVQADRHIDEGERRVLAMERAIARAALLNIDTALARASLDLIKDLLAECRTHRRMIVQSLEELDRRDAAEPGC